VFSLIRILELLKGIGYRGMENITVAKGEATKWFPFFVVLPYHSAGTKP
jgi:hypothetical protein